MNQRYPQSRHTPHGGRFFTYFQLSTNQVPIKYQLINYQLIKRVRECVACIDSLYVQCLCVRASCVSRDDNFRAAFLIANSEVQGGCNHGILGFPPLHLDFSYHNEALLTLMFQSVPQTAIRMAIIMKLCSF